LTPTAIVQSIPDTLLDPEKRRGVSVPVDIAVLIHKIVVSPAFPSWAIKSLQKAVDAAFFPAPPIEVKPSVLLDKPIIRKNPADQVASAR
jgi:hypothetical protein